MSKKIQFNKACSYLGVHIDSRLRFHEHIIHVVKKLKKFCGFFIEFDITTTKNAC